MGRLSRWLLLGEWRAHPLRAIMAVAAIAVGISLGFAIHLINAAAFNEFSSAIKGLSGVADVQVSGTEAFFDEGIYPRLAERDGVAVASPVLEFDASLPGQRNALKVIGLDAFRAGFISPDLIGVPANGNVSDTLADDAIFLSPAAGSWLSVADGATLALQSGTEPVKLRMAGSLQRARAGQRVGVMDIGAAQWRFNRVGLLSRVDLKLRDGINRDAFKSQLEQDLQRDFPGRFRVNQPNDEEQNGRNEGMSRAYRVNLTVLALVSLFTGAFLVFSTQALSVIRRRSQFALLRVLGMDRRHLLRQILLEVCASASPVPWLASPSATHLRRPRCISSAPIWARDSFPACGLRYSSRQSPQRCISRSASASRCSAAPAPHGKRRAPSPPWRSNPVPRRRPCRASSTPGRRWPALRWRPC